jgi:hypothetical protein
MCGLHQGLLLGRHGSVSGQRAVGPSLLESTPELWLNPGNSLVISASLSYAVSGSEKLAVCLGLDLQRRGKGSMPRL